MENNNLFEDMPEALTPPKLPKYFPDLQGENRGITPDAGWYQNGFCHVFKIKTRRNLLAMGLE